MTSCMPISDLTNGLKSKINLINISYHVQSKKMANDNFVYPWCVYLANLQ